MTNLISIESKEVISKVGEECLHNGNCPKCGSEELKQASIYEDYESAINTCSVRCRGCDTVYITKFELQKEGE